MSCSSWRKRGERYSYLSLLPREKNGRQSDKEARRLIPKERQAVMLGLFSPCHSSIDTPALAWRLLSHYLACVRHTMRKDRQRDMWTWCQRFIPTTVCLKPRRLPQNLPQSERTRFEFRSTYSTLFKNNPSNYPLDKHYPSLQILLIWQRNLTTRCVRRSSSNNTATNVASSQLVSWSLLNIFGAFRTGEYPRLRSSLTCPTSPQNRRTCSLQGSKLRVPNIRSLALCRDWQDRPHQSSILCLSNSWRACSW